ncbi:hypothetical protein Mal15_63760 [Stieleria maiorica]|uniref:Uncharacterized protein n=1 Tax=Stieleria maiorica TaxID=2795974 RepID=A0A5B9MPJ5_9BACT|nr:hypothetical protein Mal15_63760 [Stieleria maiorica]
MLVKKWVGQKMGWSKNGGKRGPIKTEFTWDGSLWCGFTQTIRIDPPCQEGFVSYVDAHAAFFDHFFFFSNTP